MSGIKHYFYGHKNAMYPIMLVLIPKGLAGHVLNEIQLYLIFT